MTEEERLHLLLETWAVDVETGVVRHKRLGNGPTRSSYGYLAIRRAMGGKRIHALAHRLVWFAATGAVPAGEIDHINGIRDDNRIANLRVVTHHENMRNMARQSRNISGVAGVCRCASNGGKDLYWRAHWCDLLGNLQSKNFPIRKHGEDGARRLAIEYRAARIAELNQQGAGYTARHGKD